MNERDSQRIRALSLQAIRTMRDACDTAERRVNGESESPSALIGLVLHELAWGFANASSSIENAAFAVDTVLRVELLNGKQQ